MYDTGEIDGSGLSHTLEGAKPPHLKKLPRPQISRKPSSPRGGGGMA